MEYISLVVILSDTMILVFLLDDSRVRISYLSQYLILRLFVFCFQISGIA